MALKQLLFTAVAGMALSAVSASAQIVDNGEILLEMKGGSFVAQVEGTVSGVEPHHWVLPLIEGKRVSVSEGQRVGGSFEIQVPNSSESFAPASIIHTGVQFTAPVTGNYIVVVSTADEFTGGDETRQVPYKLGFVVSRFPE